LSKILSIATEVPGFRHRQEGILDFMSTVYGLSETDNRKLRFLYRQSGISTRHSVIPDYGLSPEEWEFYPKPDEEKAFPGLESRMRWYENHAPGLSVEACNRCLSDTAKASEVTHLITVSCTGMSAPGLDLQVMERLGLPATVFRTSVNFMGCYGAIHAMKIADMVCRVEADAKVLIVCTELCTLHFQREPTPDNLASSLLFADGSAALLMASDSHPGSGLRIDGFHSEVSPKGKGDMTWELSSKGFLMTLSGYVPDLIGEDIAGLVDRAMARFGVDRNRITHWCVHPGGKRILEAVEKSLSLDAGTLDESRRVLQGYGNMSSPTILFVLKQMMADTSEMAEKGLFGVAFGPGLTMETFLASPIDR
jgi:predicted naringenin-chalcone synthase